MNRKIFQPGYKSNSGSETEMVNYYLGMAEGIVEHSNMPQLQIGAVIVFQGKIVSMGYSHFIENDAIQRGKGCENRQIAHAETSAIDNAPKEYMIGATLYLAGRNLQTREPLTNISPCAVCMRHIIKYGIIWVVSRVSPTEYKAVYVGIDLVPKMTGD